MDRNCWASCVIFFTLVFLIGATCLAGTHSAYYSWHQEPSSNYYCSAVSCQDQVLDHNETCTIDLHSCPGKFKVIQTNIMGYQTRNNINNPKIAVNQESWNGGELADDTIWRMPSINAVNPSGIGFPLDTGKTQRFRVFVPPGVTYMSLSLFCPRDDYIAVAVRWNQPPCETCRPITTDANYERFSFDRENEYTLNQLEKRDYYLQNAGGHITVYSGGPGMAVNEGGWLYVYTAYSRSRHINSNSYFARAEYTVRVNAGIYRHFFSNTQWGPFGDPPEKPAQNSQYQEDLSLHIERLDSVSGQWIALPSQAPIPENENIKFTVKSKVDSPEFLRSNADIYIAYLIDNMEKEYSYFLIRDTAEPKLLNINGYNGSFNQLAFERNLDLQDLVRSAGSGESEFEVFSKEIPAHVFGTHGVTWHFIAALIRPGSSFEEDDILLSTIPTLTFKTPFKFNPPTSW